MSKDNIKKNKDNIIKNNDENQNNKNQNVKNKKAEQIKSLINKNRGAALSFAVMLTLSTSLVGCSLNEKDDEEDDSYYSGGGHYYYSSGGTYKSGSWGKSYGISGKSSSGYSSVRGGSVGG